MKIKDTCKILSLTGDINPELTKQVCCGSKDSELVEEL